MEPLKIDLSHNVVKIGAILLAHFHNLFPDLIWHSDIKRIFIEPFSATSIVCMFICGLYDRFGIMVLVPFLKTKENYLYMVFPQN